MKPIQSLITVFLALAGAGVAANTAAAQSSPPSPDAFVARVGEVVISATEYEQAANNAARQKFYHGQPPEAEVNALMRDVADQMIHRILLVAEAKRLHIAADAAKVDATIASYEARYKDSPRWQQNRERLLPGLRARLEEDSRLKIIQARARAIPAPTEAQVRAYYDTHADKFTEPEKLHVAMILLAVAPSSPAEAWQGADAEAARLHARLEDGADFGEQARMVSADASAQQDGDLGYLHRGMIPEGLQETIDTIEVGELSKPIRVLQGVALFKLLDRKAAIHHPFARVAERARDLLAREQSDAAWTAYLAALRNKAKVELNTERYPALAQSRETR